MASKYEVSVLGDIVTFIMRVKRTSFATEHTICVTVDITGVDHSNIVKYAFSGATLRVKLQSQLRNKTESQLADYAENGYKTSYEDIDGGQTVTLGDRLMKLTIDQFKVFMFENFAMDSDQATVVFRKKHNLETPEDN